MDGKIISRCLGKIFYYITMGVLYVGGEDPFNMAEQESPEHIN